MDIHPLHPLPGPHDRPRHRHRRHPRNVAHHGHHRRLASALNRLGTSHTPAVVESGFDAVYVVDDEMGGVGWTVRVETGKVLRSTLGNEQESDKKRTTHEALRCV